MTTFPIEIRPYSVDDNCRLCDIWHDASRTSHRFLPDELLLKQKVLVAETYLPESATWVACESGIPVGFIGLIHNFIGGLFVCPTAQGRGIGTALLHHASSLKSHLVLEVYAANHKALAFYRRNGFCGVKRRETDDNGLPFALIMMQRHRTKNYVRASSMHRDGDQTARQI